MSETTQLGQPVILIGQWYDYAGGPHADVTNPQIIIAPAGGGSAILGPVDVVHVATGIYSYTFTPPMDTTPGDYLYWLTSDDGDTDPDFLTITAAPAGGEQWAHTWCCTREDVKTALDVKETARNNVQIDRAIAAATPSIEGLLKRTFYPLVATKYFPWPSRTPGVAPWRLWLDANELVEVYEITVNGEALAEGDYFLEPQRYGPPYTSIEINLGSSASFGSGNTWQRAIAVTGLYAHSAPEQTAGALAESLDDSETLVDVTDSAAIGVGQIIRIGSERMIVTEKSMADTSQNLGTSLTALANNVTVAVASGAAFTVGETILIEAERMLVVDIAGNNLIVKRQWDGSVLAAHTSPQDIYALRTLTVQRGALGTTAASHASTAAIYKHVWHPLVRKMAVAEAVVTAAQELSAYARTAGQGENARESYGKALQQARADALTALGRKARMRSV